MNIVLTHGILGFGKIGSLSYFNGIGEHLQNRFGVKVLTARLDPEAGIPERARQLRTQILAGLEPAPGRASVLDPEQAVHLIAHGTGGLDSRYLVSPSNGQNIAHLITSLTTVGTPHRGSLLADFFFQFFEGGRRAALLETRIRRTLEFLDISPPRLHDLTTSVLQIFDRDCVDSREVRYFWTCGLGRSAGPKTSNILSPAYEFIRLQGKTHAERCNDGAVTLASAEHGEAVGKPWSGDHFDIVGHDLDQVGYNPDDRPAGFNYAEKYGEILETIGTLRKDKTPTPG